MGYFSLNDLNKARPKLGLLFTFLRTVLIPRPSSLKNLNQFYLVTQTAIGDGDLSQTLNLATVFEECPESCLKRIAQNLELELYTLGYQLISKSEIGNDMYIIRHGNVEVPDGLNKPLATLKLGEPFGEVSLLSKHFIRGQVVYPKDYSEIYPLNKSHFVEISSKYEALQNNLKSMAFERVVS